MKLQTLHAINALVRKETEGRKKLGGITSSAEFGWLIGHITAGVCQLIDNPEKVFLPGLVQAIRNDMNKILETNY